MTLEDLFEEYLENCQDRCLAPKTISWYRYHLYRCHDWLEENGHRVLTTKAMNAYLRSCRNLALSTRQNMVAAFKAFGTWLGRQGLSNPMASLTKPPGKTLPDVLTPAEIEKLLVVLAGEPLREKALVYLLLDAGLRVSEVASLQRRDLDLYTCKVRVRKGKGNKDRVVHFSSTTGRILAEYLDTHDHPSAFVSDQVGSPPAPLAPNGIRQIMRRLARRHGFERLNPHLLRHTCGTELAAHNVNLQGIANHLGHESISTTTKSYIALANQRQRSIIQQASPIERNLAIPVANWPMRHG